MRRFALASIIVGIMLGACGQLPRPFQPEVKTGNALLDLRDGAGVVVQPIAGTPAIGGGLLAEALAQRLRDRDIPATTGAGNAGSWRLFGHAVVRPLSGGREEILIHWDVRNPDGGHAATLAQRHEIAAGAWASGSPDLIAHLADAASVDLAPLVQDPAVEAAALPAVPKARLVVLGVAGAPGDAAQSLPRALALALRDAKLPVADRIEEGDLLVLGDVTLGPDTGGMQAISIHWSVVAAADDRELGGIDQQNLVPAGSLDGPWGPVADEVARAAAAGLVDLLGAAGKL